MSMVTCNLFLQSSHILSYEFLIASYVLVSDQDARRNKNVKEFVRYISLSYFSSSFFIFEKEQSDSWLGLATHLLHYFVFSLILLRYLACREMQPGFQRSWCSTFLVKSSDTNESFPEAVLDAFSRHTFEYSRDRCPKEDRPSW